MARGRMWLATIIVRSSRLQRTVDRFLGSAWELGLMECSSLGVEGDVAVLGGSSPDKRRA